MAETLGRRPPNGVLPAGPSGSLRAAAQTRLKRTQRADQGAFRGLEFLTNQFVNRPGASESFRRLILRCPLPRGQTAQRPGLLCALFNEKPNHRFVFQRIRRLERRAAVGVGGVDVDAKLDRQLDGF